MNTSDLYKSVAAQAGITQEAAKTAVEATIAVMAATVSKSEEVKLNGFGSFTVKATAARQGRNPATGESIQIAAGKKLSFKPSAELKRNL